MTHGPGLDHTLLSIGDRDERPQLDDLVIREVLAEHRPDAFVRAFGIPHQHARVEERCLLPRVEAVRALEVQKLFVINLGEALLSAPERPLRPSVVAFDRLRHVHPAQFFQRMLEHAVPEHTVPGTRERSGDSRDV